MTPPQPLLDRLAEIPGMQRGCRRLVLLFSQLGDFDSLEYAQALAPALPSLDRAGIRLLAIGIGDSAGPAFRDLHRLSLRSAAGGERCTAAPRLWSL